jgi:hypothetical protein
MKLDDKTLSLDKNYDSKLHYGKMDFADRVVRANVAGINFSGFVALLNRVVSVLNDYRSKKPQRGMFALAKASRGAPLSWTKVPLTPN